MLRRRLLPRPSPLQPLGSPPAIARAYVSVESPHASMSPGAKFGKWGEDSKRSTRHYFVIANKGIKVPVDGDAAAFVDVLESPRPTPDRFKSDRTPEEEIAYLNQQLVARVRVERSLRQAKIAADERCVAAEKVRRGE